MRSKHTSYFILKDYAKRFFIFPLRNLFIRINGLLGNYGSVVWLISEGRSGSTWLSSILSNDRKALQVFEPFHPEVIGSKKGFEPYAYNDQLDRGSQIVKFYKKAFAGEIFHRRVNYDNRKLSYSGIIVKDIFVSLSSYAIYQHFKNISVIILIRNPFDVILSKSKTSQKGWLWPVDLKIFLNNTKLMRRLDNEQFELIQRIHKLGSLNEKQMVNWTLTYFITLSDFEADGPYILFYENIKADPVGELKKIKEKLVPSSTFFYCQYSSNKVALPSRTNLQNPSTLSLQDDIKHYFTISEFETMSLLLRVFNLTRLYGKDGLKSPLD